MISVRQFAFNPFMENTAVVYDETGECLIIDPGCYSPEEEQKLVAFIDQEHLKPVRLLNTHCHLDHVYGNYFISNQYNLKPEIHPLEKDILKMASVAAQLYNVPMRNESPEPLCSLKEGDLIEFGQSQLAILFAPGHSPGHVVFYHEGQGIVIGGDVLFQRSIGRTDLPGGDHDTLLRSIRDVLLPLKDDVIVYSGHGEPTDIGSERRLNPFLKDLNKLDA